MKNKYQLYIKGENLDVAFHTLAHLKKLFKKKTRVKISEVGPIKGWKALRLEWDSSEITLSKMR